MGQTAIKTQDLDKRRAHARINCDETISYACYPYQEYEPAEMKNISRGGIYFEASIEIEPGDLINVRMEYLDTDQFIPEKNKSHRAQVKWCRPISNSGNPRYGVGVQTFDPIFVF